MSAGRGGSYPDAWRKLTEAVGGVFELTRALDIPKSTMYRAMRGLTAFPEDKIALLEVFCDLYDVPNPLPRTQRWNHDLTALRLIGEAIAAGRKPSKLVVSKLRSQYPDEQLLTLAESDGTPEHVLRGVQCLLETD